MGRLVLRSRHRVMCCDSTDAAAVATLMDGQSADLLFTSPPYAQQRDYGAAKAQVGNWDALMQGVFAAAADALAPAAQVLVNLGLVHRDREWQPYWEGWVAWMRTQGWLRFGWYVWDQGFPLLGDWNGRLAPSHEFVFHFCKATRRPNKTVPAKHAGETLNGDGLRAADGTLKRKSGDGDAIQSHRIPDSVLRVTRQTGGIGAAGKHPAVFPVRLVEEVVAAWTAPGELLYEPFCGSGTQLVGAEKLGRRCFGMEIDPAYVDVAVRRWQFFTGEEAIHAKTRATFAETANG